MTRRYRVGIAALAQALAILVISGCGEQSEHELIASGRKYIEQRDPKAAAIQFKVALQKNANSPEARYLLGKALLAGGDPVAAAIELRKARELRYNDDEVAPRLAQALLAQRKNRDIADTFRATQLRDATATADLKTSLATAHLALGSQNLAEEALREALAAKPDHASALLLKARLAGAAQDFDACLALIEQVLKIDPRHAEALSMKGALLAVRDADAEALTAYRTALEADPKYFPAHAGVIALLQRKQDGDALRQQVQALKKELPGLPQTAFYEAQMLLANGRIGQARDLIQNLLRDMPENVTVLQLAGAIELTDQRLQAAHRHLEKAVMLSPGSLITRQLLAETHLRAGKSQLALEALSPMLAQPKPSAETIALAAEAKLIGGDLAAAEQLFRKAAKQSPSDPKIGTALAVTQLRKGDIEVGFAALEGMAKQDATGWAAFALVSARIAAGDPGRAMAAVDSLDKLKEPNKALVALLRGRVHLLAGNEAAARESFDKALAASPGFFPAADELAKLDVATKQLAAAQKRYELVLKADPRNTSARLAIADLRERQGAPRSEVLAMVEEAAKSAPADPRPRLLLISYYRSQGDHRAALDSARQAAAAIPDDTAIAIALASAQFESGDRQEAISTLSKLLGRVPGTSEVYFRLADAQLASGDAKAAEQTIARLVNLQPDNVDARRARIAIAEAAGHADVALQWARELQRQHPAKSAGWIDEGDIHTRRADWRSAAGAYRQAMQRTDGSITAAKLHRALLMSGDPAAADEFARRWQDGHPRDAVFLAHLGEVALTRGAAPEAQRLLQAADEARPNDPVVLNNLAQAILKQGGTGAVPIAERANRIAPGRPAIVDTLAMALAGDKQFTRAIELQRKAVEALPEHGGLRLNLARIYLMTGDKDRARREIEKVRDGGQKTPYYGEAVSMLGSL